MICYQCGSKLGSGKNCLRCGADVSVYRRIVRASNSYYNAGLEKAKLRDLSGAVECLNKSLQFYKKNTDARNLLGLIYYEMGEVVEALSQWVISKNLQPKGNLADEYLARLQKDRNSLESMNQAIKKFNQALAHAKNDGRDLAVIQLKRVLKQQPNLIKAYQLLALLYIEDEEYSKAGRLLKKALKIDHGNTWCLKYSRLTRGKMGRSVGRSDREKEKAERARIAAMTAEETKDVIVPEYRERSGRRRMVLGVLAGIAVGCCMYQFVILRTMNRDENVEINQMVASYDTKLSDQELVAESLEAQVEALESEQEEMQGNLDDYTGSDGVLTQYDEMLTVVQLYMAESQDTDKLAEEFAKLDESAVDSDAYREVYSALEQYVTVDMVEEVFTKGKKKYDKHYYKDAIEIFEQCLEMNADYDAALYYLGLCYEKRNDDETAQTYFQQIVDRLPESEYYDKAKSRISNE